MYYTGNELYYKLIITKLLDSIPQSVLELSLLDAFNATGTTYNAITIDDLSIYSNDQYNIRYAGFIKFINDSYYTGFENYKIPKGIIANNTCLPTTVYVPTTSIYVPTTTVYIPTTSIYVPTTTAHIPTTTAYIPTTTVYIPISYSIWYATGIVDSNPCGQAVGQLVYATMGTAWNSINKFYIDSDMTIIYEGSGYIGYTDMPYGIPKYYASITPISGDLTGFNICP